MEFTVTKLDANQRIDKFLRKVLQQAPLSFIYKMFRQKDVKVNGKKEKIDYILKENDVVSILNELISKVPVLFAIYNRLKAIVIL